MVEDVATILKDLLEEDPFKTDVAVATERLKQCFAVLRRETGFRLVIPGESLPVLSYDLVHAKESVETAIQGLADGDIGAAMGHIRSALSSVQHSLRH